MCAAPYIKEMKQAMKQVDRREFVLGSAAVVTLAALAIGDTMAQDAAAGLGRNREEDPRGRQAHRRKTDMDLPEIAENGNTVPFTINVDSPMTDKDYVKAIHVISTGNPQPGVATFHFIPQSGKAAVASRMRLARTQDIIALAELSDGRFMQTRRSVKVTIGGCGG